MTSIVDELNELLIRERGEAEAIKILFDELQETDSDLLDNADDILRTEAWSCSGLYHRISQLHGKPSTDALDLIEKLEDKDDVKSKLEFMCKSQKKDRSIIKSILKRDDLDQTTRDFLTDLLKAHENTTTWCDSKLNEWKF